MDTLETREVKTATSTGSVQTESPQRVYQKKKAIFRQKVLPAGEVVCERHVFDKYFLCALFQLGLKNKHLSR